MQVISASSIGTFGQGKDVEVYQTCNNCSYCNITAVKYPNSTNILTNVGMVKDGTYFSYTVGANNLTSLGEYAYCYHCGNGEDTATGCLNFEVTPTGIKPTNSQGILYGLLFLVALVIFSISLFGYFAIDGTRWNKDSITGSVTNVNWNKYYKFGLIFICYAIGIWIMHLGYEISRNILYTSFLSTFFHMIYTILLALATPFSVTAIIMFLVSFLADKKTQALLDRGLQP